MDIITNPLTPANTTAVTRLDAVTGITPLVPTTITAAVDLTPLSSTTVDLSPLGQFLSSLSLSRKTLTQLQGAATAINDTSETNNAEAVTTAAQQLANAFNVLQTNAVQTNAVGTAQSAIDRLASDKPDTPLQPQIQTQTQPLQAPAAGVNAASNLDALAQLGITLQTSPIAANNNTLVVDEQTLQAAFAANPAGTVASLNQAADTLDAFGADLLRQSANAVTQANSIDVLDNESTPALQQTTAVRDTFAADNGNSLAPKATAASQHAPAIDEESVAAAVPQTTLADMALTDLLGETQQASQAIDAAQISQEAATQLSLTQADAAQAAQSAQAAAQTAQATDAAIDQQQDDAALTAQQAANAAAATEQADDAATATMQAQAATQANNIEQASAATSNTALQTNAETGIEEANRLARDPAIAAAIAAYHLNDGPLHTDTAEQELAVLSQRQIVAPVAPVARVDPAEKA